MMAQWFETSPAGMDLIKRFEGCEKRLPNGRLTAYKKPGDPWTIGWGQTGAMPDGRPVVEGLTITQQEADEALVWFVKSVSDPLTRKHFNAQTQDEFDALSSWVYNINHAKLERGQYSLPALVNLRARDLDAVIAKWIQYKNPNTIFEQGLYRRRLAELCVFMGLPWHFALSAVLKRQNGVIVDMTDPAYILEMAEAAKPIASLPDPPKAPKPTVPVDVKPLPEIKPEPQVGTKPISPKTVQPSEVPYKIDPQAGLKPLEESERAIGYFWQNLARLFLRLTGMGTFGTAAAGVANVVQSDAVLGTALMDLTIPMLVLVTGIVIAFVAKQYGDWRRQRGEKSAKQGLY
jgi:GH24 family phage-related lysozyme (muramidase)